MFCLCFLLLGLPPGDVRFASASGGKVPEIIGELPAKLAATLQAGKITQEQGEMLLEVRLLDQGKEGPAMLGAYGIRNRELVFLPRFGLQPEKTYRARLRLPGEKPVQIDYLVPAREAGPRTTVVAVWPNAEVLPANQLRFHVQFSRPMRGGPEIFDQIQLVEASGKVIPDAWLRDELWNDDGTSLILYIHPGRIKWGVLLRLLMGPVLLPERSYKLVVRDAMLDADGRKLAKEFAINFRTSAEDRSRIDLSRWKITAPHQGQRDGVELAFATTLDHRGLSRFLQVMDANQRMVAGTIQVGATGRSWKFIPAANWSAQDYTIVVDEQLEDVAGNTATRPFDVDSDARQQAPQKLSLTFRPQP